MKRTLAQETIQKLGQKVLLRGWVNTRRDHGKIVFIDLRDRSGIVQVICGQEAKDLRLEYVVEIAGTVRERPKEMVNPKIPTGKVEVEAEKIKILAKAETLPFDMGAEELNLELPTLLDNRSLTLRHPKIRAIFKIQETVIEGFREALKKLGFTEFAAPTIVPVATEGGAEIFPVKYYDYTAYLGQSPQLYKQIMVSIFERVFTVTKAYRAEPSVTTRHISEYISLDAEMGFIDSWEELMDTAEYVTREILAAVGEKHQKELGMYQATIPELSEKIPRIKMREAQEIIYRRTGRDNRKEPDLTPSDEREICRWSKEEHGSDLVFITHFPTEKRPFYAYPDPEDPGFNKDFDLLGRGLEWVTGGQRINDYQQLLNHIKKWGNKPEDFEIYLQAFRYGMPPEGGFALGAERITMQILGLKNIREASLFPRDMERVDVRLSRFTRRKKIEDSAVFEKVKYLLGKHNVKYKLFEHEAVYTCEQAAKVRGTGLKQGAKALVMLADKKPLLLVLSAATRVDTKKFKKVHNIRDLRMATAEEARRITGIEIGAVPPFGNVLGLPTYVDKTLLKNKEIVFNAGSHTKSIRMKTRDFVSLVKPKIGEFSKA